MIKSSLDLVQANRLIQYQLNHEISDIIQTQNRINRIGQTRETKAYYIATDVLQANVIDLFLETYRNIRVAHKGIVELFVDMNSQVNIINDYLGRALSMVDEVEGSIQESQELQEIQEIEIETVKEPVQEEIKEDDSLDDKIQELVNLFGLEVPEVKTDIKTEVKTDVELFVKDDEYHLFDPTPYEVRPEDLAEDLVKDSVKTTTIQNKKLTDKHRSCHQSNY